MTVYIAQVLCPQRHCYLAAADEYESDEEAGALRRLLQARLNEMARAGPAPKCALCGNANLHIELAATGFASMEEARPALMLAQERQRATAAFFRSVRN